MTKGTSRGGFGSSRELGKYRLINELAKSQLGALWAAMTGESHGEETPVFLVRRFDTSLMPSPDRVDELSEAAFWAMEVSHAHVARTLDVVMIEDELGMVYEYTEGEVFRALLRLATFKRRPLPVPVALRISLDLLDAVAATRDQAAADHVELPSVGLTPDSVLVSTDGTTRLLDVGAAGVLCGSERVLNNPDMAAYLPPEQLEDATRPTDARADVFTTGVLMWEMLLGKRLFVGSNFATVAEKVKEAKVPRLDLGKPVGGDAIPGEVADLVARALLPEAGERFADCGELAAAIQALSTEPAAPDEVGKIVDALDGNALATRRKVIDRARGVKTTFSVGARLAAKKPAEPSKPEMPGTVPPPKPTGQHGPPPPPRERMGSASGSAPESLAPVSIEPESLPPESIEPESLPPESLPIDVVMDDQAPSASRAKAPPAKPARPVKPVDVSEGALIAALTTDSTPKPGTASTGASKGEKPEAPAEVAAEASSPEASSAPDAASIDATTLDAATEEAAQSIRAIEQRTQRARRYVAIGIGGLAAVLLLGLGVSALTGDGKPEPAASTTAPPPGPSAASATAAPTASAEPAASASAGSEKADEDAGPGDAAEEPEAAASATAEPSAAPPAQSRAPHHYKYKPRPKHKYTPSGI